MCRQPQAVSSNLSKGMPTLDCFSKGDAAWPSNHVGCVFERCAKRRWLSKSDRARLQVRPLLPTAVLLPYATDWGMLCSCWLYFEFRFFNLETADWACLCAAAGCASDSDSSISKPRGLKKAIHRGPSRCDGHGSQAGFECPGN